MCKEANLFHILSSDPFTTPDIQSSTGWGLVDVTVLSQKLKPSL